MDKSSYVQTPINKFNEKIIRKKIKDGNINDVFDFILNKNAERIIGQNKYITNNNLLESSVLPRTKNKKNIILIK